MVIHSTTTVFQVQWCQIATFESVQCHPGITYISTQRHSIAKSVGCFQRRLFVCLCVCVCVFVIICVCLFVCRHDNFRTNKHRMIKLGGRCMIQQSLLSSNFRAKPPWASTPQKCGVAL